MIGLLLLISIVLFIANIGRMEAIRNIFTSPATSRYAALFGGLIAWGIVGLVCWALWQGIEILEIVLANPVTFGAAIALGKLLAIIMGIAYLYQMVIDLSEAGSTEVLYRKFLKMLFFQGGYLKKEDVFEKVEQMTMRKSLEDERKERSNSDTKEGGDPDHEKYFGL